MLRVSEELRIKFEHTQTLVVHQPGQSLNSYVAQNIGPWMSCLSAIALQSLYARFARLFGLDVLCNKLPIHQHISRSVLSSFAAGFANYITGLRNANCQDICRSIVDNIYYHPGL